MKLLPLVAALKDYARAQLLHCITPTGNHHLTNGVRLCKTEFLSNHD